MTKGENTNADGIGRSPVAGEGRGGPRISGQLLLDTPDPEVLATQLVGAAMPATQLQWAEDNPDAPLGPYARRSLASLAAHEPLVVYLTPSETHQETPTAERMDRAFRDQQATLHDLGAHVIGVSTQSLAEQHDRADIELYGQTLLCDQRLVLACTLGLPVTIHDARVEYQPLVMIVEDGAIAHVIYPVESPDASAHTAVRWLTEHTQGARACAHPATGESGGDDEEHEGF
jgi:peroxiredoxin